MFYELNKLDDIKILPKNEIHIWLVNIHQENISINADKLYDVLDRGEKERLARYIFEDHKKRFLYSRGILKLLLSNYLDIPAKDVLITYNDKGKPSIDKSINDVNINFNLSHSRELITFVFTLENAIGVDMEYIDRAKNIMGIAKRFFNQREYNYIKRYSGDLQYKTFYILWTFKEALLKCYGSGLGSDFKDISIPVLEQKNHDEEKQGVCKYFGKLWNYIVFEIRDEYIINLVYG